MQWVQNMTKRAKGTHESCGRNVKVRRGLNRSILRQDWTQFEVLLQYKAVRSGIECCCYQRGIRRKDVVVVDMWTPRIERRVPALSVKVVTLSWMQMRMRLRI